MVTARSQGGNTRGKQSSSLITVGRPSYHPRFWNTDQCVFVFCQGPPPLAQNRRNGRMYGWVTRSMVQIYLFARLPWFANVAICRRAKGEGKGKSKGKQRLVCITILPFPFGYSSSYQDPDPRKRRNEIIILPHVRATKYLRGWDQYYTYCTINPWQKKPVLISLLPQDSADLLFTVSLKWTRTHGFGLVSGTRLEHPVFAFDPFGLPFGYRQRVHLWWVLNCGLCFSIGIAAQEPMFAR